MYELIPLAVLVAINIWLTYRNSQQFLSYVDQYAICTSFLARALPLEERATLYYAMSIYKQTRDINKAQEAAQAAYPALKASLDKLKEGQAPSDSSQAGVEDGLGFRVEADGDKPKPH